MIPAEIVAQIHDTAQIEDIVNDFVNLKKRGANLLGLCPFHNEKTPSFTVSPTKNIYKCFGCGKAGNPVGFIMEHEQFSYPEALRYLAKRYNIDIPEVDNETARESKQLRESLQLINVFAEKHFIENLVNTNEGINIGLSYFKERGYLEKTIEKFKLGYSLSEGKALLKLLEKNGYKTEYAAKIGLVGQRDNRSYDFFRERVMFPIHNLSGKVIAFAGRTLSNNKKTPKYVNSPESEIYVKNKVLYGIFQAKSSIRANDNCYLVEGYTDVISMHQAGIENVVASSGTSLTDGQIRLIKRFTQNITVLYDGDAAGIKAAMRGTDMLLAADMNIKVAVLPEGEDPDSFVKQHGHSGFEQFISNEASDFILFKIKILLKDISNDPIKKSNAIRSIVESLSSIPDPIKRSLYIKQCSQLFEVEEGIIISEVNKLQMAKIKQYNRQKEKENNSQPPPNSNKSPQLDEGAYYYPEEDDIIPEYDVPVINTEDNKHLHLLERYIIRAMLLYGRNELEQGQAVIPYIIQDLNNAEIRFDKQIYQLIFDEFSEGLVQQKLLEEPHFLNHSNMQIAKECTTLIADRAEPSENWFSLHQVIVTPDGKHFKREVKELLDRYKLAKLTKLLEENQEKLKQDLSDEEVIEILQIHQQLKKIQAEISKRLGIVIM